VSPEGITNSYYMKDMTKVWEFMDQEDLKNEDGVVCILNDGNTNKIVRRFMFDARSMNKKKNQCALFYQHPVKGKVRVRFYSHIKN